MNLATEQAMPYPLAVRILSKIKNINDINQKMVIVLTAILQSGSQGLTTREVSEKCNMTIHAARNWLTRLEYKKLINRNSATRNAKWRVVTDS